MYKLAVFEDVIRVPPENIGKDTQNAILRSLSERYENKILKEFGVILSITDVLKIKEGFVKVEDAGIYYPVKFESMVFLPKLHQVIIGSVVDITDFGVFIRFGPIDGLCHISQIINDYINHDKKSSVLTAKKSGKTLKIGDTVIARVIGVSLEKKEINKINLTMRQPGLGALDWIEQDKKEKLKRKKVVKK